MTMLEKWRDTISAKHVIIQISVKSRAQLLVYLFRVKEILYHKDQEWIGIYYSLLRRILIEFCWLIEVRSSRTQDTLAHCPTQIWGPNLSMKSFLLFLAGEKPFYQNLKSKLSMRSFHFRGYGWGTVLSKAKNSLSPDWGWQLKCVQDWRDRNEEVYHRIFVV